MSKEAGDEKKQEQPVVEASTPALEKKIESIDQPEKQPAEQVATPVEPLENKSAETAVEEFKPPNVNESLGKFKDYAPFIYNVGSRAFYGAAWGGLFGLVFFRSTRMKKFSVIYGAGFGLGMCAP